MNPMKKFNCIMLIDDDETCNFITDKIISKLDLSNNVLNMKNGMEAITFLENNCKTDHNSFSQQCPELIFLDLNMPVMDGLEFLEELYSNKNLTKNFTDNTNIYVLTSSDNQLDIDKISKFKIKGYISKPMTIDKISSIARIHEH